MKIRSSRYLLAGAALALALPAARLSARQLSTGFDLYSGQPAGQSNVKLGSWGSGTAQETGENIYAGAMSIKVATQGRYQGARIIFTKPVDMTAAAADPNAYLQIAVKLPGEDDEMDGYPGGYPGGPGGYPGGYGRNRRLRTGGPGGAGGPGGRGGYGGGPYGQSYQEYTVAAKPLADIRLVLGTTDGKRVEAEMPVSSARRNQETWSLMAIPVAQIPRFKDTNQTLSEIDLFGDTTATLYVGAIQVVRDETPIRVDDLPEQTVAVNDTVTFSGSAEAGPTALKYEWNFGGKAGGAAGAQGLPVDAEGRTITHQFRKSGDYTVTLTVRDIYGVKKPASTSTVIHVTL